MACTESRLAKERKTGRIIRPLLFLMITNGSEQTTTYEAHVRLVEQSRAEITG